MNIKQSFRGS